MCELVIDRREPLSGFDFACWSCGRPEQYGERLDCWKCEQMLDRAYRFAEVRRQRRALAEFALLWIVYKRPAVTELPGSDLRRELEGIAL